MDKLTRIAALWFVMTAGAICAQEPTTPSKPDAKADVAVLAAVHKADLNDVAKDYDKWSTSLKTWYLANLEKLLGERAKAGDLDGAVASKAERDRFATDAETTQEQIHAMPPALGKLRAAYEDALKKIDVETNHRKDAAGSKHLANLEALQKRLTMSGNIEEALQVKQEKDRLASLLAASAVKTLGAPESTDVPATPDPETKKPGAAPATPSAAPAVEHISNLVDRQGGGPITIKGNERITTKARFAPPVEITIVAKTESTNLRMGYAADAVIFNWEGNGQQLRVDGGPANGKHKQGAGAIPKNQFVTIRWVVFPTQQSIYVNDELRYEHSGDYSHIDKPISVFCHDSKVTVESIKVARLPWVSANESIHDHSSSFVLVKGDEGSGSGFLCKDGGSNALYTNVHVIEGILKPKFTRLDSTLVSPGETDLAAGRDVARIATKDAPADALEMIEDFDQKVRIGDRVVVPGNSGGGGVVTSKEGKIVGIGPDRIEISAEIIPGNSGSPIIHLDTGKVIGIATYGMRVHEDPLNHTKETIRRFGYRIDHVKTWERVDWNAFRQEADRYNQVVALTDDMSRFLNDLVHRFRPTFTTATLRGPAQDWLNVRRSNASGSDSKLARDSFLRALKLISVNDVATLESQAHYTWFRDQLQDQKNVRDALYKAFDGYVRQ